MKEKRQRSRIRALQVDNPRVMMEVRNYRIMNKKIRELVGVLKVDKSINESTMNGGK